MWIAGIMLVSTYRAQASDRTMRALIRRAYVHNMDREPSESDIDDMVWLQDTVKSLGNRVWGVLVWLGLVTGQPA